LTASRHFWALSGLEAVEMSARDVFVACHRLFWSQLCPAFEVRGAIAGDKPEWKKAQNLLKEAGN